MTRTTCRILIAAFLLLGGGSLLAGDEPQKRRYLVGTEGPSWTIEHPFREPREVRVFRHVRGFAVEMTEAEAAELGRQPGIRFVESDPERHILEAVQRTPAIRRPFPAEGGTQQTPYGIGLTNASMVWPVTRGGGVKVAVIDTGIDTTHPDLVGAYSGGWDFVNDDADPQDDNGHGTHVSGTIAAADNTVGVVGVAPDADLYALKILDAEGSGRGGDMIAAVDWAIDPNGDSDTSDHMDVINLSLGGSSSSILEREAFERARAVGIVCVAASGNNHPERLFVDFPAAYPAVIAVGAIDQTTTITSFSQRGPEMALVGAGFEVLSTVFLGEAYLISAGTLDSIISFPMEYSSEPGAVSGSIVSCGRGGAGEFPAGVAGNVALIERGDRTFKEKSDNAKSAGAKAAIIYNNESGIFFGTLCAAEPCIPPNTPTNPILTVSASMEDGQILLGRNGDSVTIELGSASDYGLNNGTSMATPHVAGVAALLKALDPFASEDAIRTAMQTTARDLGSTGFDTTYGYGLADAYAAGVFLAPWRFDPPQPGPRRRGVRRPGSGR